MGRIKTQFVKRLTHDLIKKYRAEFKTTFDENKKVVASVISQDASKKLRNIIAGYVTRQMKKGE
jgi:small subunit ribosomal protein S17e